MGWHLPDELAFVTTNEMKAAEVGALLGRKIRRLSHSFPEVQDVDCRVVAAAKARSAFDLVREPLIVDDSGLVIPAWGGLPGAYMESFMDRLGAAGMLRMMSGFTDRSAQAVSVLAYCDGDEVRVFEGRVPGRIVSAELPGDHIGYDSIFQPDDGAVSSARTLAVERMLASIE